MGESPLATSFTVMADNCRLLLFLEIDAGVSGGVSTFKFLSFYFINLISCNLLMPFDEF